MRKGTTSSGFSFEIDETIIEDDYELFEDLCALDRGELTLLPKVVNTILGAEQTAKMKSFIRAKDGRVSTQKMMALFTEVMTSAKETKNS